MTPESLAALLASLAVMTDCCAVCGHPRGDGDKHHGHSVMDYHHTAVPGPRPQGFGSARAWWYDPGHRSLVVDYVSPTGAREPVRLWFKETPERREAIAPEEISAIRARTGAL